MSTSSVTRRTLLASSVAAAGIAATPAFAKVAAKAPASQSFHATLDAIADRVLALSPEAATSLGVDVGARAALRARLSDRSTLGEARYAAAMDNMMAQVRKTDRAMLSPDDRLRWDTVHYALKSAELAKPFFYASAAQGFQGGTTPYAVTQQSGTIAETPEFLDCRALPPWGRRSTTRPRRSSATRRVASCRRNSSVQTYLASSVNTATPQQDDRSW